MLITLTERRNRGGSGGGGMKTNSCIMLSKAYNWIFISLSLLQPNIFIYNWWSCCWYFGIYRLERICVLFTSHGTYFTWACGQSKIFNPHILWLLESSATWWLSGWPNGRLFMFISSFFGHGVYGKLLSLLYFLWKKLVWIKIGRHTLIENKYHLKERHIKLTILVKHKH